MKKEFIVAKIEAATDGSPYIYVSFKDPNEYFKSGSDRQMNPFGPNVMAFTSPEDLMKNLPKAMSNISNMFGGGVMSDSPSFKVTMKEYEELKIKVGEKVTIEIQRVDQNDI